MSGAGLYRESPVSTAGLLTDVMSTVGPSGVTPEPVVLSVVLLKVVKMVEPVLLSLLL